MGHRELNALTLKHTFPLPPVDDLLDNLGSSYYFSTLDLASGYRQIKEHIDSRPRTAFVTHVGSLPHFIVMQQVLMSLNTAESPDFGSVYS